MITRRLRTVAALALAATPLVALAGSAAAAPSALLPDDLAFLDSAVIDDVVAGAEGGRVECAALSAVMGIAFASALVSSDWNLGLPADSEPATTEAIPNAEAFWAVASPLLVPLLDRASTDDPAAEALVAVAGPDLVDAIYELRDLGLTDDDLLLIQQSFAYEVLASSGTSDSAAPIETVPDDSAALAGLEERAAALISHEFESITFLDDETADEMPEIDGDSLPWETECPETAGMFDFDFDMEPVSATVDFEVTITIP